MPDRSSPEGEEGYDVKPMAAALTGALVAGVGMYAIGAHAQDSFATNPALAGNPAISYFASTPQPLAQPMTYTPVAFAPACGPKSQPGQEKTS